MEEIRIYNRPSSRLTIVMTLRLAVHRTLMLAIGIISGKFICIFSRMVIILPDLTLFACTLSNGQSAVWEDLLGTA